MIKADKSLEEVWEMKAKVTEDFLKSGYSSIIDFIKDDTEDFIKQNNIRFYKRSQEEEKQLTSS